MIIQGGNVIISVGGQAIAASKTCSISLDVELIEVASTVGGDFREFIPGRLSWKVSTEQLISQFASNLLLATGQRVTLQITVKGDQDLTGDGQAIVTSCRVSAARGSIAAGQFEFTGSGYLNDRLHDLFLGTVLNEYVRTTDGKKLRIRWQ